MGKDKKKEKKNKKDSKGEEKQKRAPTKYNVFMKKELQKIKEKDPKIDHKEAFVIAAKNWTKSSDNPKNAKEKK